MENGKAVKENVLLEKSSNNNHDGKVTRRRKSVVNMELKGKIACKWVYICKTQLGMCTPSLLGHL